MTHKRIEYDGHAIHDMDIRGFSRSDVKRILFTGVHQLERTDWGEQRHSRSAYIGAKRPAKVVYLENAERFYIISVQWLDRRLGKGTPE